MKGIIVYRSTSGSTETYARWLADDTGFDCLPVGKVRNLESYDLIVLGSNIRMYRPSMAKWIIKRWPLLSSKKTLLFTVAGAPKEADKRTTWLVDAIGNDIASKLPHFPLNGKMVFADMPPMDRWLMNMGIKMNAKKNPEQAAAMSKEYNGVKREDLAGILAQIKALS